ncbi:SAM-dependent methyltransferase [Frankia sp. CcI49]|uniref:SAM-dependent methyltransferase n=1 Tax=unclassified Frankia TaxID=2632575 RepID=UPI0006CA30B6|nr:MULTISPECIES: SAM-dependent methyltransferase [unclassified Frankia]KPM55851.1 SAM-dependent methyltransferase [Frankia sp. R43]ONH58286.1 SAM-dependent methyltransferase [Frankia sp. CcI49]
MDEVPRGVGRTALATAWIRARASRRPDRLFDDWLAQLFVDAAGDAVPVVPPDADDQLRMWARTLMTYLDVRTRFFDDELGAAVAAGCRQVVVLAAGLDTRAFRLPWPDGTLLFEVDRPDMLSFKERVLASTSLRPRCERHPVVADLTEDWVDRLLRAGLRPSLPTAWLAEGILVYLEAAQAERLLTNVTDLSAPSSRFALEDATGLSKELLDEVRRIPPMGEFAELWHGGLQGESAAWLGDHGWRGHETTFTRAADRLGRRPDQSMPIEGSFVTAQRTGPSEPAGVTRATAPSHAGATESNRFNGRRPWATTG